MGFSREKRKFLAALLGEERTKALEERLPALEALLMAAGVDFKEVDTMGRPFGGATSWGEVDAYEEGVEAMDLASAFGVIISNIMASDMSTEAKAALVAAAADDLEGRLADVTASANKALEGYPLAHSWRRLGLTATEVAGKVVRADTGTRGLSHEALYRLLRRDNPHDRTRVLEGVKEAALSRGKSLSDVDSALADVVSPARAYVQDLQGIGAGAKALGPEASEIAEELEASGAPAGAYVADVIRGRAVQG